METIKKLAVLTIVLLLVACSHVAVKPTPESRNVFDEAKELALTAVADKDGSYFVSIDRKGILYSIGYFSVEKLLGAVEADANGMMIVCIKDETDNHYEIGLYLQSQQLDAKMVSKQEAEEFFKHILSKFHKGKKLETEREI